METTVNERIRKFCKEMKISIREFERKSGLSNGYLKSISNSMGSEKLRGVISAFPNLNANWLLYGEGEMFKSSNAINNNQNISHNTIGGDVNNNISNTSVTDNITNAELIEIVKKQGEQISKSQEQLSKAHELLSTSQDQLNTSQEQVNRLLSIIESKSQK